MKSFSVVALFAALAGSADAFAPVSSSRASTSLKAQTYNPELEGMSGVTVETGNKVVSWKHAIHHVGWGNSPRN